MLLSIVKRLQQKTTINHWIGTRLTTSSHMRLLFVGPSGLPVPESREAFHSVPSSGSRWLCPHHTAPISISFGQTPTAKDGTERPISFTCIQADGQLDIFRHCVPVDGGSSSHDPIYIRYYRSCGLCPTSPASLPAARLPDL